MERTERAVTGGEVALVRSMFGQSIDTDRVRLVHGKFWPLHLPRSAMAPMGHIHFHPHGGGWSEDFSLEPLHLQGYFIHEMTHVWQAQKGGRFFLPLMRHPFCRYRYSIVPGRRFEHYGLEQQAEIVRHIFLADHGGNPPQLPPRELLPFY